MPAYNGGERRDDEEDSFDDAILKIKGMGRANLIRILLLQVLLEKAADNLQFTISSQRARSWPASLTAPGPLTGAGRAVLQIVVREGSL